MEDSVHSVNLFLGNSKSYPTRIFRADLSPRPAIKQIRKSFGNLLMAPGLHKKLVFGENPQSR